MESGILYNAIFENEKTLKFNVKLLEGFRNIYDDDQSEHYALREIVFAFDVSAANFYIYHDMKNEHTLCTRV